MMQRKRRHQRQAPNSISKMTTSLNNSILKNLAMDQSVYEPMNCDNEEDIMSQSLNLPSMMEKGSRKRVLRRRMRRTASDNTDLGFHIVNLIPQGKQTDIFGIINKVIYRAIKCRTETLSGGTSKFDGKQLEFHNNIS
jgi:hypothetical protein